MTADTAELTDAGRVAAFYSAKLGRAPTEYEARCILYEELAELEAALAAGAVATETLKEMADVLVTLHGYALARGWNLTEAFRLVCDSNMTKEPTTAGKIHKGADYVPPDLRGCV